MRALVFLLLSTLSSPCLAGEAVPAAGPSEAVSAPKSKTDDAIERGAAFLARDALAWKAEHNCVSCHHASLVAWSLREVRNAGYAVDEAVLAEMTTWTASSGDGTTGVPRPEGIPKAINAKAVWFALALGTGEEPGAASFDPVSLDAIRRYSETMKRDQEEDGSWSAWPETRPPIFGDSDESMTVLASLALSPAVAAGDEAARAARDRGAAWLESLETDDGEIQSVAMRLLLWKDLGRPADQIDALVQKLIDRQNADGGWSQTREMESDGWATGQALLALDVAGVGHHEPAIARAREFLIRTQLKDGSWPMTSRPTVPGGAGSTSLIPIVGAGSSWAVMGLARAR